MHNKTTSIKPDQAESKLNCRTVCRGGRKDRAARAVSSRARSNPVFLGLTDSTKQKRLPTNVCAQSSSRDSEQNQQGLGPTHYHQHQKGTRHTVPTIKSQTAQRSLLRVAKIRWLNSAHVRTPKPVWASESLPASRACCYCCFWCSCHFYLCFTAAACIARTTPRPHHHTLLQALLHRCGGSYCSPLMSPRERLLLHLRRAQTRSVQENRHFRAVHTTKPSRKGREDRETGPTQIDSANSSMRADKGEKYGCTRYGRYFSFL